MDKEWIKYWEKAENLENTNIIDQEEEKSENIEQAKDLYKSVLSDNSWYRELFVI